MQNTAKNYHDSVTSYDTGNEVGLFYVVPPSKNGASEPEVN